MLQPLPRRLCKIVALHRRPRSGPDDAARIRSSIVYVSLWAYGHAGPWAMRRGFDSLVQTASGFNDAEAQAAGAAEPKPLPCQALESRHRLPDGVCRHDGSRAPRPPGGSWHVRASLAQTGHWLRGLGRSDGMSAPDPRFHEVRDRLRPVHRRAPCRRHDGNAAGLAAPVGAARHRSGGLAEWPPCRFGPMNSADACASSRP